MINPKLCIMCRENNWVVPEDSEKEQLFWKNISKEESERTDKKGRHICIFLGMNCSQWVFDPPDICPYILEHTISETINA